MNQTNYQLTENTEDLFLSILPAQLAKLRENFSYGQFWALVSSAFFVAKRPSY